MEGIKAADVIPQVFRWLRCHSVSSRWTASLIQRKTLTWRWPPDAVQWALGMNEWRRMSGLNGQQKPRVIASVDRWAHEHDEVWWTMMIRSLSLRCVDKSMYQWSQLVPEARLHFRWWCRNVYGFVRLWQSIYIIIIIIIDILKGPLFRRGRDND